ncbi:S-acyl fatty acid synthase thioesterase, medium chain-like [Dreissena polymorpha]|uniref:S-acyl fatty acid synthase thioesterase, medium chain n=1 Tax=Dreissena polymorpha TaxID=45954 RepID=A0A9D4K5P9_DREPO|nr:S-acyl fatty acid synthase thioesterase, medium chain-like [Dreissena polymorpha]XP_052279912.1 S-acyl fatty acid synthase thioesterase, medium chain-like [Dreissena polymorpha]XP_052279913.1 S-acyl fatty acid synthase thioesterase, medium chain-like [Dreissena polymorpha]XP_052279914.1 S-acyl fatty acid synthase thioesterase, medium chain-like [Dreissena polymorpha]XP_052279915.1 S-acyl fatty acid synthase thioesterase, medium chain-like [Dreissena polymorpha]KAH3833397.1 hypothetical prot
MCSKVLNSRFRCPDCAVKLFCFPWAGGGAVFYANWGKTLQPNIEVHGVCLTGRENRFKDPVPANIDEVVEEIVSAIQKETQDTPFAFWGHSFGSHMALVTALRLKTTSGREPVRLFVSGASPPHSAQRKVTIDVRDYTDEQFIEFLRKIGGTPPEILDNKDYISLFLPPLKADFDMLYQIGAKIGSSCARELTCPVDAFDGEADNQHDLDAWADVTTGPLKKTFFPGGHFYFKDDSSSMRLLNIFSETLML